MNLEENVLNALRQTILQHQWKEAYETISLLFAKDVPHFTVFVANQMMRSRLRFQARYDLAWIARFAQDVIDIVPKRHGKLDFPDEIDGNFMDVPYGITNLVHGAEKLWESVSVAHEDNEKAKYLAIALDNFIIAEQCNYWEAVYPGDLQLADMFFESPTTTDGRKILPTEDKQRLYRAIAFLKQPESIGYRSARLLGVVDEIELRLNK